jgi:hypothetical protein
MSTKFEQLLDLIVNEEMDKANELFHEIVVEKSRDIYENLIAEEAEEEEMDEAAEESDEEMDESAEEDDMDESVEEETDESVDLEDSYSMEADDEEGDMGGDATDDFGADVGAMDGEEGGEAGEDAAIFDIKNAIEELEAAFAKLEQAQGGEEPHGEFGDEEGGEEDDMDMMGKPAFEGRRMTREYTENVGTNWEKGSTQKAQGQYVGAGSGDKEGAPVEGKSPISSGSGKPNSGANAKNLAQGHAEGQNNTGTSPGKVNNGITKTAGEKFASGINNVDGKKSGVKTLSKVAGGHGAEKKGAAPGPVGSGTGDKAGQTSVANIPTFLKKL